MMGCQLKRFGDQTEKDSYKPKTPNHANHGHQEIPHDTHKPTRSRLEGYHGYCGCRNRRLV
jgi:hypothetical protein